ncbi:hypothetical protein BC828DRAFT_387155, partial [Blastocladiella britannica]
MPVYSALTRVVRHWTGVLDLLCSLEHWKHIPTAIHLASSSSLTFPTAPVGIPTTARAAAIDVSDPRLSVVIFTLIAAAAVMYTIRARPAPLDERPSWRETTRDRNARVRALRMSVLLLYPLLLSGIALVAAQLRAAHAGATSDAVARIISMTTIQPVTVPMALDTRPGDDFMDRGFQGTVWSRWSVHDDAAACGTDRRSPHVDALGIDRHAVARALLFPPQMLLLTDIHHPHQPQPQSFQPVDGPHDDGKCTAVSATHHRQISRLRSAHLLALLENMDRVMLAAWFGDLVVFVILALQLGLPPSILAREMARATVLVVRELRATATLVAHRLLLVVEKTVETVAGPVMVEP